MLPNERSRPTSTKVARPEFSTAIQNDSILAEVDALAAHLRGYLVVQVVVDDEGHRRTNLYRSATAAQKAVERAKERGRTSHVTLCQLLPVGVVVGLDGGRDG